MDRRTRVNLIKLWLEKARDDLATAEDDYQPTAPVPTPEQASTRLDESRRFVDRIERYLREVGALE